MKKKALIIIIILLLACGISFGIYKYNTRTNDGMPLPQITGGERGKLGIDKNINEKTIDKYLGREDSVYRDMRMLVDPGDYEAIGGDSVLTGYVNGFEIVPLPYIFPVEDLPSEVGVTYVGDTLFKKLANGKYEAVYEESMKIIEELFPKDKYIFLMCGGGGYAGMMKEFLVSMGWNKDKIYVVGGYWYYEGENNVEVVKFEEDGLKYDFDSIPYHEIDFTRLHKIKKINNNNLKPIYLEDKYYNTKEIKEYDSINPDEIYEKYKDTEATDDYYWFIISKEQSKLSHKKAEYLNNLVKNKESFVLMLFEESSCEDLESSVIDKAKELMDKYNIYFYESNLETFRQTKFYDYVQYSPSILIINKGDVYMYTDPESDEDAELGWVYQDFEDWFKRYVIIKE